MGNPTQFTYVIVVKQNDDVEQISTEQMQDLLQFLITAGTFVEIKAIEPITLLPEPESTADSVQPLIKGDSNE